MGLFGAIGGLIRTGVKKAKSVGQKIISRTKAIGEKLQGATKAIGERVQPALDLVNNAIRTAARKTGISKIGKVVGEVLRDSGDAALSVLPQELRGPVKLVYGLTPVGNVMNAIQWSADVASGRTDAVSDATLRQMFPEYDKVRTAIDATQNLPAVAKNEAKKVAKREAMKMAFAIAQAAAGGQ